MMRSGEVEGKGVHDEEEKLREKESMMRKRSGGKRSL
jgi:hypothetical protein